MNFLKISDCLETGVARALDHEHPPQNTSLFAIFSDSLSEGPFCGLATPEDVAAHPHWIFADLVEHRPTHAIFPDLPVEKALDLMNETQINALPVLGENRRFLGIVTRSGILQQLLAREKRLLEESHLLRQKIEADRVQLASWSSRLTLLHSASRTLLGVLAHTSLESDLLQHGIEALTHLLQARYGAIGILNGNGGLERFHHTGIPEDQVSGISHLPEGKGLLGTVVREDCAIRIANIGQDVRSSGFPAGHPPMTSLLAVPISHGGHVFGRIYLCDKLDGNLFSSEDELLAMSFSNSLSLVLENARRITELEHVQQRLDYLAHFDTVTGLPNRELLTDRIRQVLANARRHKRKMALMFVDIDNFKAINDAFGHLTGDALLKSVAGIIASVTRAGDTVARLSGDEFVVVLSEISLEKDAASVAEKIVQATREPIWMDEIKRELAVTVSIGISVFPQDGDDEEALLSKADSAMYHSKSSGRNTFQFFTPSLNKKMELHLKLEQHLRQAMSRHELSLHYQPQVDVISGEIVGVEALMRWSNPELGMVPPVEFIPVAEETGLIIPIGAWALEMACHQAARWHDEGRPVRVSVNVSAQQFHHHQHFSHAVRQALEKSRLPARLLELEITESLMLHNIEAATEILLTLKQMGIRLSMDDFGTGYASLSHLQKLPVDVVKIDQSFVKGIGTRHNDAVIVATIAAMARQLGLQIVAEGVETLEQVEFIRALQCDMAQGYHFSKPLPADEMSQLLEQLPALQDTPFPTII